ncbi:uncharacterized protein LOC116614027 [Nematostella vectensis]|uniref:uncharacterized protein LOC116614027 n=1 Tax=Nematostella vectensis TaxID=45351 RepID=UPI0020778DA0|nr:uncharacterized protein LOC116614027 [Nematostella vectensis]
MLLFLELLLIQGAVSLSCDFEKDFCGWQHPRNATDTWILTSGNTANYTACLHQRRIFKGVPSKPVTKQLIYPNFTGSGDLVLSYYSFHYNDGKIGLRVIVGDTVLLSEVKTEDFSFDSLYWKTARIRINAYQKQVVIEGLIMNNQLTGIVIDNIKFYEKNASFCPQLSAPLNGTMNCTHASTAVGTVCVFACVGSRRVVGSTERHCLPTGEWSGIRPICQAAFRLSGGYSHMDGDVEIQLDGRWGKICLTYYWSWRRVAQVACRSLGYEGEAHMRLSPWQQPPYDSWMSLTSCDGSERSLTECSVTFGRYACDPITTLAVICGKTQCPANCSCSPPSDDDPRDSITCRKHDIQPEEPILIHHSAKFLFMYGVDFIVFRGIIDHPANLNRQLQLSILELADAGITRISKGTFSTLESLNVLRLPWNKIESLSSIEDGAFWEQGYGLELNLGYNNIRNVTVADMKGKELFSRLELNDNKISYIEGGAFNVCVQLKALNLSTNNIRRLMPYTLPNSLISIDLRSNVLEEVLYDVFGSLRNTYISIVLYNNSVSMIEPGALDLSFYSLDLAANNLTDISTLRPKMNSDLFSLLLGQNKVAKFSRDFLVGRNFLKFLDISDISLGYIERDLFKDLTKLLMLNAVRANIQYIDDFAFEKARDLVYIFLDNNLLTRISRNTFVGPRWLFTLNLANNPIEVIEEGAFATLHDLQVLYLVGSKVQVIDVGTFSSRSLTIALFAGNNLPGVEGESTTRHILRASGYDCPTGAGSWETCYPCSQGQYKIDGSYLEKCTDCSPGGFYQDVIAHIGELSHGMGCKQCPPGTFVSPAQSPGRVEGDCSACPDGTDLKKFAGFRACPCLPGYFRLDRFGLCKPCPYGYNCSNESVNLMPGFYWTWYHPDHIQEYQTFARRLKEESRFRESDWDSLNGSLPVAYLCPFTSSCRGDFNATCSHSYEGVLCGACSRGYYRMFSGCNKCPSTPLVITQFVGVFLVLALIAVVVILNWKKSRADKRSLTDQLFGSLKIVIGFYQILSGTLNAYSYIQWPDELLTIMKYADVLQLNIFTVAPTECISDKLKVDPYSGLLGYVLMDCAVIFTAFFYYNVRKMSLSRRCHRDAKDTLFDCKANCYQAVFLFLFITYPATCTKIFQALPAGCQEVCDNTGACKSYFRSDYAVECFSEQYNKFVYFVYASLIIPMLFPVVCAYLLWQHCSEKHHTGTFASLKRRISKMRKKSRSIDITSLKETHREDRAIDITSLKETQREDRAIDMTSLKETHREDRAIDMTSLKETQREDRAIDITSLKETHREDRAIDMTSLKETQREDRAIDITSLKETQREDRAIDITSLKETQREDRAIDITSLKETQREDRAIDITSLKETQREDRAIDMTSLKETQREDRAIDITSLKETQREDRAIDITSLKETHREDRAIDMTSLKETQREDRAIDITSLKETQREDRAIDMTSLKETQREDRAIDITSLKETQREDRAIDMTSLKETQREDRAIDMTSLKETQREDRAIDITSLKETHREDRSIAPREDAITKGLRFMYENYTNDCWYWEIIELLRKVILTSLLAYYGQDNPFYLGTSAVLSGLYAVFFANQKPIPYVFEYWLHLGSLVAVMATQLIGMVLRIPGEDVSVDQGADQLGITILLLFSNVFVIVMIVVRYMYSIWLGLKVVRANPQCSMGCLMNVLQIVTQGEEQTRGAEEDGIP